MTVSLSFTPGTVSTFYDSDCDISNTFWTVSFCMLRTNDGHEDDEDHFSADFELSGSFPDTVQNTCSFIQIEPDTLETTVQLENLEPCTQYTFTIYTRHMAGNKRKEIKEEKVITEMTLCQGK